VSVLIQSSVDAQTVAPGAILKWTLNVLTADGAPAVDVWLHVSASDNLTPLQEEVATDQQGKANIEIQTTAGRSRGDIEVRHDDGKWHGRLYVTEARVTCPQNFDLSESDENLLRMLYYDKTEVHVFRQFGSGQSGNRVFQVRAFDDGRPFSTQIVKLGIRDEIRHEAKNYEIFCDRLAKAAPIRGIAESGVEAAIIYGDAAALAGLDPVVALAEHFTSNRFGCAQLHEMLYSVLAVGLQSIHGSYEVKNCSPREVMGKWLPENLVISINEDGQGGVFQAGNGVASTEEIELTPRDVEKATRRFSHLNPGDRVLLRKFRVGKVQRADLNLEDEGARAFRVKVRFDGAAVNGVHAGDTVDVVGQVIANRAARLDFAVRDCLARHHFKSVTDGNYQLDGEAYPDPLHILPSVLDIRHQMAWASIHGDLHWENILAESPSNWCLIDYGLSGRGAVLFDFIKLEVYLRKIVLANDPKIEIAELLAFERNLLDDPFGDLPTGRYKHELLNKATYAIRTIRRLARPYMIGGFAGYRDLLFCYAIATTKYYPTHDLWAQMSEESTRSGALHKSARQTLFALAPALCLARGIESERILLDIPKLRLKFVPLGSVLPPEENHVALDVGNRLEPGIIDHHHLRAGESDSTAGLVWKNRVLIQNHVGEKSAQDIKWVLHEQPDFDAVAALFLAWHLVQCGFFPPGARSLQHYATLVDKGDELLESARFPERTPYALFMANVARVREHNHSASADEQRTRYGLEVMRNLAQSEANGVHALAHNECPHEHGLWHLDLEDDEEKFWRKDFHNAYEKGTQIHIRINGHMEKVGLLALRDPQSLLFKLWARRHGFRLMVVFWPQPEKPDDLAIISVPGAYTGALKGLGHALEEAESKKRKRVVDKTRTGPPRWEGVDNSDPWYDGRSPAHKYTIVAGPRMGTVLTMQEILKIVRSPAWQETPG
jgi:hypothetical protein